MLLLQLQRAAQTLAGPGGISGWQQLQASFDLQERARLYGANEMCIPVKTTLQLIGSEMWWVAGMQFVLAASAVKAHVPLAYDCAVVARVWKTRFVLAELSQRYGYIRQRYAGTVAAIYCWRVVASGFQGSLLTFAACLCALQLLQAPLLLLPVLLHR